VSPRPAPRPVGFTARRGLGAAANRRALPSASASASRAGRRGRARLRGVHNIGEHQEVLARTFARRGRRTVRHATEWKTGPVRRCRCPPTCQPDGVPRRARIPRATTRRDSRSWSRELRGARPDRPVPRGRIQAPSVAATASTVSRARLPAPTSRRRRAGVGNRSHRKVLRMGDGLCVRASNISVGTQAESRREPATAGAYDCLSGAVTKSRRQDDRFAYFAGVGERAVSLRISMA